jgi:hypothetical protein
MESIDPPTPPTSPARPETPPPPMKRKVGRPRKETNQTTTPIYSTDRQRLLQTVQQMEEFLQAQKMKKMIKRTLERQQMKQWMRQPPSYQQEEYSEEDSGEGSLDDTSGEEDDEEEVTESEEDEEVVHEQPVTHRSPLLVNRRTAVTRKRQFR